MRAEQRWEPHSCTGQMILRLKADLHDKLHELFKHESPTFSERQVNVMLFEAYKKGWLNCADNAEQSRNEVIDSCIAQLEDLKETK